MVKVLTMEQEAANLHSRFDAIKAASGMGQAEFARKFGIPGGPSMVSQHIKGRRPINLEAGAAYARGFGVPLEEISPRLAREVQKAADVAISDQAPEALPSGQGVPLISWVQAGAWSDVADPFEPGDADEWLPCPVKHGPRAYCVRVRGDSMHNPGGRPSYADGDIIFVDPDRGAKTGDRVIVRLDDHQEATFKQLLVEDGRKLLKALNPEWSPRYIEINGNATITGVVIGKWVPE
jgi:SOS-response transcriptional repressor LexA